eukprot:scaffold73313_cov27-Tisochrysis_lutea.AAC.10
MGRYVCLSSSCQRGGQLRHNSRREVHLPSPPRARVSSFQSVHPRPSVEWWRPLHSPAPAQCLPIAHGPGPSKLAVASLRRPLEWLWQERAGAREIERRCARHDPRPDAGDNRPRARKTAELHHALHPLPRRCLGEPDYFRRSHRGKCFPEPAHPLPLSRRPSRSLVTLLALPSTRASQVVLRSLGKRFSNSCSGRFSCYHGERGQRLAGGRSLDPERGATATAVSVGYANESGAENRLEPTRSAGGYAQIAACEHGIEWMVG